MASSDFEAEEDTVDDGLLDCGGASDEVVTHLVEEPLLEDRRITFDARELISFVAEALTRKGLPSETLDSTRWLWVMKDDVPTLYLILPGYEA